MVDDFGQQSSPSPVEIEDIGDKQPPLAGEPWRNREFKVRLHLVVREPFGENQRNKDTASPRSFFAESGLGGVPNPGTALPPRLRFDGEQEVQRPVLGGPWDAVDGS